MKVVLLDRDGTVIVDPPDERVTSEDKIQLFPDTISALKKLADNDFAIVLITNQAGIAEGRITEEDFTRINDEVIRQLAPSGVKILKTYMCPHSPDAGCECRKPKPAMLLQAIQEFNIDKNDVFMLGDRPSDVMAGKNAGIKSILVRTANHQEAAPEADYEAQNLTEAIDYVITNS